MNEFAACDHMYVIDSKSLVYLWICVHTHWWPNPEPQPGGLFESNALHIIHHHLDTVITNSDLSQSQSVVQHDKMCLRRSLKETNTFLWKKKGEEKDLSLLYK